jgi:hypothetical protein
MESSKTAHLVVDPPFIYECKKPEFLQQYALVSFVSPEDNIQKRFFYSANKFLYHDVNSKIIENGNRVAMNLNSKISNILVKKIETYESSEEPQYQLVNAILKECLTSISLDVEEEANKFMEIYRIDQTEIEDKFETYLVQNKLQLDTEINNLLNKETSVRGFKIRGVFEDLEYAKRKAKELVTMNETFINIFVAPVGHWVPYDPNPDAIEDQEYMISELDNLMKEKKKNQEKREEFF